MPAIPSPSPTNAYAIGIGEIGITNAQAKQHILGSFGAAECVIVAMYNPVTKTAVLSHVDVCTNIVQTVGFMTSLLAANDSCVLEVHLATSVMDNNPTLENLRARIQKEGATLKSVLHNDSLAVDSQDGGVIDSVTSAQLDLANDTLAERTINRGRQVMFAREKIHSPLFFDGRVAKEKTSPSKEADIINAKPSSFQQRLQEEKAFTLPTVEQINMKLGQDLITNVVSAYGFESQAFSLLVDSKKAKATDVAQQIKEAFRIVGEISAQNGYFSVIDIPKGKIANDFMAALQGRVLEGP